MSSKKNPEVSIRIRSVKQYFNDFIVEGLKDLTKINEIDLIRIKTQMLDAFRKEIFEQIADKLGPEAATLSRDELAKIEKVNNILVQEFRKWKRLCILCSEAGLGNYFQLEDLRQVLVEEDDSAPDAHLDENMKATIGDGVDVTDEIAGSPEEVVYLNEDS